MFLNSSNSNEGLISILEYMPPHATKFFLEKHTNNILIVIPIPPKLPAGKSSSPPRKFPPEIFTPISFIVFLHLTLHPLMGESVHVFPNWNFSIPLIIYWPSFTWNKLVSSFFSTKKSNDFWVLFFINEFYLKITLSCRFFSCKIFFILFPNRIL